MDLCTVYVQLLVLLWLTGFKMQISRTPPAALFKYPWHQDAPCNEQHVSIYHQFFFLSSWLRKWWQIRVTEMWCWKCLQTPNSLCRSFSTGRPQWGLRCLWSLVVLPRGYMRAASVFLFTLTVHIILPPCLFVTSLNPPSRFFHSNYAPPHSHPFPLPPS